MQRKIYRLLATDFCCWVPITVMAFVNFSIARLPDIAYVISAIVLLPINSALNPVLYSDVFDKLFLKVRRRFKSSHVRSNMDDIKKNQFRLTAITTTTSS